MNPTKLVAPLPANPDIHQFLAHHIDKSELTQREIATACGFRRPTMISMIKSGDTRVPLERVEAIADALHLDFHDLFRRWMASYYPETWNALRRRGSTRHLGAASQTGNGRGAREG